MLTRAGISYNFDTSPYKFKVEYNNGRELVFTFSGEYNLNSFKNRFEENRDKINASLSNRFKMDVQCDILCDIKLYTLIEKRGFLIEDKEERYECLNIIKLDGLKLTTKN